MTDLTFQAWPKISRLNRDIIITEKIDGSNACVIVQPAGDIQRPAIGTPVTGSMDQSGPYWSPVGDNLPGILVERYDGHQVVVAAQSRKKIIAPGKQTDNAGFAGWVRENAQALADTLGEGYHFGEWYGSKIQRTYGLDHKRFALFNTSRWENIEFTLPNLEVVPVLARYPVFDSALVHDAVEDLKSTGSTAVPGFMKPEGVVVFHVPSQHVYKVLCENDELPKGVVERQDDRHALKAV